MAYAERDDKHGLGTISNDMLDKAFGLSGLISSMNRNVDDHQEVVRIILPLLDSHIAEEIKRTEELPREFEQKLKDGIKLKEQEFKKRNLALENEIKKKVKMFYH